MNEYWRDKLDRESDRCYARLLQGIQRQEKDIDCGNASVDNVKNAYLAIYNDHPELFYLSSAPQIAQRKSGFVGGEMRSCSSSVVMTPIYSSKEIRDCELKIDHIKATLKKKITFQTTDEQKVLLAAEYIVRNTVYEIDNRYNQNAASALCFGKAQCSGISKAFKLLMDDLGVDCISISGDAVDEVGNAGPHAWNIVKIADNYYHVDITFMLGANTTKSLPVVNIYLFYDDDAIAKNHSWDRSQTPSCTDKSKYLNDIEKNVFYAQRETKIDSPMHETRSYNHYSSLNQLKSEIRETMKNRKNSIAFYLDIGMNTPSDMARAIQNAVTMVATKESIHCTFAVSISHSLLVNIEIEY